MACKPALPAHLRIHNVFHISSLKKYIHDSTHVIDQNVVQEEPEGKFQTEPLRILEKKEIVLRKRVAARVKVKWNHFIPEEATWELEEDMQKKYPGLFLEAMEED